MWNMHGNPFGVWYTVLETIFNCELKSCNHANQSCKLLLFMTSLPINFFLSSIWIYIIIPLGALESGVRMACYNDPNKENKIFKIITPKGLPFWKMFEYVGEAIPQLTLALVYYISNREFVDSSETHYGISIPTTVISIIFSSGSTLLGLYQGIALCRLNSIIYVTNEHV